MLSLLGPVLAEQLDDFYMTIFLCPRHGRFTVHALAVDIRTVGDQKFDYVQEVRQRVLILLQLYIASLLVKNLCPVWTKTSRGREQRRDVSCTHTLDKRDL